MLTQTQVQASQQARLFAHGIFHVEGDLIQFASAPGRMLSFAISVSTNGRPESSVLPPAWTSDPDFEDPRGQRRKSRSDLQLYRRQGGFDGIVNGFHLSAREVQQVLLSFLPAVDRSLSEANRRSG